MMLFLRLSIACALFLTCSHAMANAIADFQTFVSSTQAGRAQFEQQLIDVRGVASPKMRGTFLFSRPGKFRWTTEKPEQVIVGDGKKVYFFDKDLNQVTVKKMDSAFSSTPAALLAGKEKIEAAFTLVAIPDAEGLSWLDAIPRHKDAGIEKIKIGFHQEKSLKGQLAAMELFDAFGNRTKLSFAKVERNPSLDAKEFIFVAPKGADVVGE